MISLLIFLFETIAEILYNLSIIHFLPSVKFLDVKVLYLYRYVVY